MRPDHVLFLCAGPQFPNAIGLILIKQKIRALRGLQDLTALKLGVAFELLSETSE